MYRPNLPQRLRRLRHDGQRGQLVILAGLTMVVVLAFAALAIDVGQFLQTRTKLQADVDSMALGGAQELCGTTTCNTDALAVADNLRSPNSLADAEAAAQVNFDCSGNAITNNSQITAKATRHDASFLAQVIGFTGTDIQACATAAKYALGGAAGLVPFGIEESCLASAVYGDDYTLKFDSDTTDANGPCEEGQGNYAALGIDASGDGPGCNTAPGTEEELKFKQAICFGANRGICAVSAIECDGEADDDTCSGDSVSAHEICTETGNMTGPIKEGLGYRVDHTSSECDEWEEVADPDGGGLLAKCDPWDAGGPASERVIMIPVVSGLWGDGGTHKVTVVAFAVFFLENFNPADCSGNDCDITGRFIRTQMHTGGLGYAPLDPGSAITLVKLLE